MNHPTEEVLTVTGSGGRSLTARLDLPAGETPTYALFAHCFPSGNDIAAAREVTRTLTEHGIAVLRFDFPGLGQSDGDVAEPTFSSTVADLVRVAEQLREHHRAPNLLIGHSRAGAAVLAAAERIPEVRAVATIGAPCEPEHEQMAGRQCPLLVAHSPQDEHVDVDNARLLFEAAPHPKSFMALDGADHHLNRPVDAEFAGDVIATWARRHTTPLPNGNDETIGAGSVRVAETGSGRFTQRITTRSHTWAADEPASSGGTDSAPDPYDLLLSALGACTSMTLRMYAERKEWDLRHTTVTLNHDRLHARDCADCETTSGKLDRIVREVHLDGDLDGEQRARLLAIADKCPVHRTLQSEIVIETDEV